MNTARNTAAASKRVGNCPLEQRIANALTIAGIRFLTDFEGSVVEHLDFFLPDFDTFIEVKGGPTPRTAKQLCRAANVVVLQGDKAVELFASFISAPKGASIANNEGSPSLNG